MPSQLHEVLAALVREHPELAITLVQRALGLDLGGPFVARISGETLSEIEPAEYRADAVFELLRDGEEKPSRALIVEVQLRPDPKKRLTWPMYQAGLRRRLGCPVLLIVVAPSASAAQWCSEVIDLDGLGRSVVRPLVVGPRNNGGSGSRASARACCSVRDHAREGFQRCLRWPCSSVGVRGSRRRASQIVR